MLPNMNEHIKLMLNEKIVLVGSEFDGKPFIKAMLVSRRESDNIFYFDSNNGSNRVAHWRENPAACVYFYDKPAYRGVMLTGTMEIINDLETKKKHWRSSMKAIYSGGVTDPDYCILKFLATSGRHYFMFQSEDFKV